VVTAPGLSLVFLHFESRYLYPMKLGAVVAAFVLGALNPPLSRPSREHDRASSKAGGLRRAVKVNDP
jgi:hypothetical protein